MLAKGHDDDGSVGHHHRADGKERRIRRRRAKTCCMRLVPVYYGWVVLFVSCLVFFASAIGHTSGINMVVPHFMEDFHISSSSASGVI